MKKSVCFILGIFFICSIIGCCKTFKPVEKTINPTLPKEADMYLLSAEFIRSQTMLLNGRPLVLGENNELPNLDPVRVKGEIELPPATCTFFVIK